MTRAGALGDAGFLGALIATGLGVVMAPLAARQQPQNSAAPTGLILGRVVEAVTNQPVRDAIVQIAEGGGEVDMAHHAPAGDAQPLGVLTDADGQFVFSRLSGGSYRLWARRQGYHQAAFGARRPNDAGTPLVLANGERRGEVVVRVWKYAAITGVVTDEFGDPVVQAPVRAYVRTTVAGHPRLGMNAAYGTTDDRGVYRLSRLIPGEYVVGVIRSERSAPASLIDARQRLMAAANRAEAAALGDALSSAGAYVAPLGTADSVRLGQVLIGLTPPIAPAASDGWMTYPTQFFPGVAESGSARAIPVGSGDQITGIDFRLRAVRTRSVSGIVSDANGPVARFPVRLLPTDAPEFEMEDQAAAYVTLTDDAGRFAFPAVPTGNYVVRGLRGVGGGIGRASSAAGVEELAGAVVISTGNFAVVTAETPPPPKPEPTRYATTPITIGDRDITNVSVTLAPGSPVSGTVQFLGRSDRPEPDEFGAIGIVVDAIDGRMPGYQFEMTGSVDREGRFETVGLPAGRYLVRVPRVPAGWTLESVQFGGRDVSDVAMEVGSSPISGLTIRLTRQPAILAGTVRTADAKDDLGRAMVVVFPADRARWRDYGSTPRRLRDTGLSADGRFHIEGLPPGEYFVAAIPDDFVRNWRAPALLERMAQAATRITTTIDSRTSHALTLTPLPAGGRF